MMRSEFEAIGEELEGTHWKSISDEDYEVIEKVYNYHPAISDKREIVKLYIDFGMTIIKDMVPRAEHVRNLENEIDDLMNQVEKKRRLLNMIYDGKE